jgi:hypothetical protein
LSHTTARYKGWAEWRTAPGKNPWKSREDHFARLRDVYDVIFSSEK